MAVEEIRTEKRGAVATVIIDAPPLNLLTPALLHSGLAALDTLEAAADIRCVVLRGAGERAFSAGAKLGAGPVSAEEADAFRELGRQFLERLEAFPKPVVSAVCGWCVGGGFALSQACDIRLAREDAKFRTGDAYIGVVPAWGMSLTRLVHWIGRNRAMDMLMLGEDLTAADAAGLGLLTRVFPAATFENQVAAIADRLAGGSLPIFRAIKQSLRAQYQDGPAAAQAIETAWSLRMRGSDDAREGVAALKERRLPRFMEH